ncbi:MAG TPA: hypothetical protein PKI60_00530 [Oscillospiraceae bacterium]|nr:hypothetical protein [Oscillospiraceae bacterium]
MDTTILNALKELFSAKQYVPEMVSDMSAIIAKQIVKMKSKADEFEIERASQHLEKIMRFDVKTAITYRLYIVVGIEAVVLICLDLSQLEINNIINTQQLNSVDYPPLAKVEPNLISSLYIFKNEELIYDSELYPFELAPLMHCLSQKNIIKYPNTEDWIIRPNTSQLKY